MSTVTMTFTGQSKNLHIIAELVLLDNLYLTGKIPLLVRNMLVNFLNILSETSKGSACWEMAVNSHLKGDVKILLLHLVTFCKG